LIQEAEVGVRWTWKRGWRASQRFTAAALLDGFLVVIGFPNRFSQLAQLAERYQRRD